MTKRTYKPKPELDTFPNNTYLDTRCSYPKAVFPHHSTHSATNKQTRYLAVVAKKYGYKPPRQTCCSNHVGSLIHALTGKRDLVLSR
jgi:hypothetical protein